MVHELSLACQWNVHWCDLVSDVDLCGGVGGVACPFNGCYLIIETGSELSGRVLVCMCECSIRCKSVTIKFFLLCENV